jgi:2-succinyl-5-enolpyruvyl-6-hydroxy-3-cyclohexene-1-carboxylate synthase
VDDDITLDRVLENFFKPDNQPKILEVNTYGKNNADIQKAYFNFLKEN